MQLIVFYLYLLAIILFQLLTPIYRLNVLHILFSSFYSKGWKIFHDASTIKCVFFLVYNPLFLFSFYLYDSSIFKRLFSEFKLRFAADDQKEKKIDVVRDEKRNSDVVKLSLEFLRYNSVFCVTFIFISAQNTR